MDDFLEFLFLILDFWNAKYARFRLGFDHLGIKPKTKAAVMPFQKMQNQAVDLLGFLVLILILVSDFRNGIFSSCFGFDHLDIKPKTGAAVFPFQKMQNQSGKLFGFDFDF